MSERLKRLFAHYEQVKVVRREIEIILNSLEVINNALKVDIEESSMCLSCGHRHVGSCIAGVRTISGETRPCDCKEQ